MRRISAAVTALGALVLALGAGATSAQAGRCDAAFTESRAPSQLSVRGDTCANARRVASRVAQVAPAGCIKASNSSRQLTFRTPCVRSKYTCRSAKLQSGRSLRVTCTRGARSIRFLY
jgi:hypothetical protein